MPASIIVNQIGKPAGVAGVSRRDLVYGVPVTLTNASGASTYAWAVAQVPRGSGVATGPAGTASSLTFTPDVPGVYRVTLRVNGSEQRPDNAEILLGILTSLNVAQPEIDKNNQQVQQAVVRSHTAGVSRPVFTDPATGMLHASVVPGGGGGGGAQNNFTAVVDPTVNDDTTLGYSTGSMWENTATNPKKVFFCRDATDGAADWLELGAQVDTSTFLLLDGSRQMAGTLALNTHPITGVTTLDYVPAAAPAGAEGRTFYDSTTKSLSYTSNITSYVIRLGHVLLLRVRNQTGAPLAAGVAVYVVGAHASGLPTVALAQANVESTSLVVGLTSAVIADNTEGFVVLQGIVDGLDTSTYVAAGTQLYLSAATPGALVTAAPTGANLVVAVAKVTRLDAAAGSLTVHVRGGVTFSVIKELLGAATSELGVNGQKITSLGTPTAAADAATKAYVDALAAEPVWVVYTTADGNSFANGVSYQVLPKTPSPLAAPNDYIQLQLIPNFTGNAVLTVLYAMSVANGGAVQLKVDYLVTGTGDDPSTGLTTQTAFTVTPGNDVLGHVLNAASSATLQIAVTAGKLVLIRLSRVIDGSDTHTGDFRYLDSRIVPA